MSSLTVASEAAQQSSAKKSTTDSAWILERMTERATVQQAYASDPKYKKYTQQVEKCLNSFDNVHEWADCIAFLKQLLKTFQSYMQFKEIPKKLIVAKRLSQCLNPALPTGVHQRALDVYAHILAVLGSEGLKRDLPVWSSGLFPFFEFAATSVKPTLLNLYDTHYLPLQAGLRPIMKSFILALLPGLEEETGEFFEKVLSLLDRLSGTVSPSFFFQNIWLVMITTPPARGTALNFLSRRLPNLHGIEDITSIVGRDIGLMIRAFSAALEDDNLLVRRGALDLLLQSLRVDSAAVRRAQADDRTILMRAAVSVVLRRDLSLNRRLYSWLLGPDDKSEKQIEYLKTNALELLRLTLREDMVSPSTEYSESRPFKIFISLLDKWEIGSTLSEVLVYDAFKALKHLIESSSDGSDDVSMTASTLYEAVEPQILWRQLLSAMFNEIMGDGEHFEAIDMVLFILKTFSQDEEIQIIHLPLIFTAIVDLLDFQVQKNNANALSFSMRESLLLLDAMLRQIPHIALLQRPELNSEMHEAITTQRPYNFACTFYGIKPIVNTTPPSGSFTIPFGSGFEGLTNLSMIFAQNLSKSSEKTSLQRQLFSRCLTLIDGLAGRLDSTMVISWNPKIWLAVILESLSQESANFATADKAISLIVALHQLKELTPNVTIDDRSIMSKVVNKLLRYLRSDCAVYHVRAVNLIWSLEVSTTRSHVESILAQTMTSPELRNVQEAYEAFGVLWRLTEDNSLPGFRFKVPMMIVLDTLKNDDPNLRRIGETWMRCSLKSYIRVLDPILFELMDPSIRRIPDTMKVKGRELPGFTYERPLDQRYTNHLLEMLLSIIRFGGQGFAKTAKTSAIKRSHHTGLVQRVEASGFSDSDVSYLDILVELLLRFLQSEPKASWGAIMHPQNLIIQSTTVDLLQAIVARGEISTISVEAMEAVVIGKLYFCVHLGRLNLQNKLLHLLHSVLSASIASEPKSTPVPSRFTSPSIEGLSDNADAGGRTYSINPLLIQTLLDGLSTPSNRPILQHWLDFVLMAIPQFQPSLQAVVAPLNDCVGRQLLLSLKDVRKASTKDREFDEDTPSTTTDAEFIMLLNALERLVLLSLAYTSVEEIGPEDDSSVNERPAEGSTILGIMSTVFSSDSNQPSNDDQLAARSPAYRALSEGVQVLYLVWGTLSWSDSEATSSKDESLALIHNRSRSRCRRVLEHLFRAQSAEVFECLVDCWNRDTPDFDISPDAPFELIDVLVASAQSVVHMICESISIRVNGPVEKTKKQAINPDVTDAILFRYLERYLQRLEGPLAIQVWGRFLQLTKEVIGSARDLKPQTFPTLRCVSVLAEKITQTTAMEDRRVRKDLQEVYGRLLDSCLAFVGRTYDSGGWIRRTTKDALTTNGRDSPAPRGEKPDEKVNLLSSPNPQAGPSNELVTQISEYVSSIALPNLRKFLMDNDKVTSACTNVVYYIVSPSLKGKSRPLEVDPVVVTIVQEMAKIPSSFKAWRSPISDLLNDNRLFSSSPDTAEVWKPIFKTLFDNDKTAFPELLSKISTAPSANIFTNREYEMLLRSQNLRRLSFVLLAGDKNHFLTQLPSIQEKLVDVLRNVTAPIVQSEVYLCIRVLLCRLSPHNLTSFWPVVLTELYRVFEQTMISVPSDGSEDLPLVLAACKCLDLLLTLQTEEFQIHQWMFITDTVDAIYRPDGWSPEAMMDQLAEIVGNMPRAESHTNGQLAPAFSVLGNQRPMRRPLLGSMRQIDSMRDLIPFFSGISISSYESIYASAGNVDWDTVEKGLMEDMFDGR
ncbi:hypothetical protein K435DRAFT_960479 [Dendrothele bispora CBS 962.96]|uniref:Uncharacterized protein n=1 Tax=Dendrothele bispora (strain CBS 962.96) TaxID=1314807 RepID=A0A4S8MTG3_DENBC|nr:hypothetical protein K435DRAFT_960479 [Dendrothele bispora CBS 962.96]